MGRNRNPQAVSRRRRNIEARIARERRKDDESREFPDGVPPMRGYRPSIYILDETITEEDE